MSECTDLGFFGYYQDNLSSGGVLRNIIKHDTTATAVSNPVYANQGATLAIHISGTASVIIKNRAFGDSAKDFTIKTVTATTQEVITSAMNIVLDVTVTSGTVTAIVIPNED